MADSDSGEMDDDEDDDDMVNLLVVVALVAFAVMVASLAISETVLN